MTPEEIKKVEELVNQRDPGRIWPVVTQEMSLDESAKKTGAMALFGEKVRREGPCG